MPHTCNHCGHELDILVIQVQVDNAVVLRAIRHLRKDIMSTLDDLAPALAGVQTGLSNVQTDVTRLLALVQDLGDLTPEQQAKIDEAVSVATGIANALTDLDASIDAVSPDAPPADPVP